MLKVISGIKLPIAAGCYVNSGGIAARTFATGQALRDQHE